jgi:uncharacterized protein YhaN
MKITDIRIERFGVWHDCTLSLRHRGLNVFYGPNETGKTTLMRFIRGLLYGFEGCGVEPDGGASPGRQWGGALGIEVGGQSCEIRRIAQSGAHGLVTVKGLDREAPAETQLDEILSRIDARVFESVFAIGLFELQQLATLENTQCAERIYGMSLGPDGECLIQATEELREERKRLFDTRNNTGTLATLRRRFEELERELESLQGLDAHHVELRRAQETVKAEISNLKQRQEGIQSQLEGHQFLDRIWTPWNQVREIEGELASLPAVTDFPEEGCERLNELDEQLAVETARRDALENEATRLRNQADDVAIDQDLLEHAMTVQSFIDRRDWIVESDQELESAAASAERIKAGLDQTLKQLGGEWSLHRLESTDVSPSAAYTLAKTARKYQSALSRKRRLQRRYQQMSRACQRKIAESNERTKRLGVLSISDAIHSTKQKLSFVEELHRLRLREVGLNQQQAGLRERLGELTAPRNLPRWMYAVLGGFGLFGVLLVLTGVIGSFTVGLVIGAVYVLLGLTSCGIMFAFHQHFAADTSARIDRIRKEDHEVNVRLSATRKAIGLLVPDRADDQTTDSIPQECLGVEELAGRLGELEQIRETHSRVQSRRRLLSELRVRLQTAQRDVSTARQGWCQLLTDLGFTETVRIEQAFAVWQHVSEGVEQHRAWQAACALLRHRQESYDAVDLQIEHLRSLTSLRCDDDAKIGDVLTAWEAELETLKKNRAEQQRLRHEAGEQRQAAERLTTRVDELTLERTALLVQGGAGSREEFEQRAACARHRRELDEYLAVAQAELEAANESTPNVAIVEEDLLAYDPDHNTEHIEVLASELVELESDLERSFEKRGRIRQAIAQLEDDRRPAKLRFERAQLQGELKRAAQEWFAVQLAGRSLEKMKARFEQAHQPTTLAEASKYLEQLTGGIYRNVWTPLGEQYLCVDDYRKQSLRVEQLSNGTREQLFLAIRLTLVRELADQGIHLPMVLDDVIVNFDQQRSEAAVETLLKFSDDGQQVLFFTCHRHLAELFRSKGIEPIWLPERHHPVEERRAG